jgi:hypothetical protein
LPNLLCNIAPPALWRKSCATSLRHLFGAAIAGKISGANLVQHFDCWGNVPGLISQLLGNKSGKMCRD